MHVLKGSLNQALNVPKISVLSKAWFLRGLQCFLELQETTVAQDSVKKKEEKKRALANASCSEFDLGLDFSVKKKLQ